MSTAAMNVEIPATDEGGRRLNNRIRTYTTRCAATLLTFGIISFLIFHFVTIRIKDPKYSVTAAVLSRFNLTTTANTTTTAVLSYHLSLNITIRNPSRYYGYYYDMVRATAYYGSQKAVISTHVVLPPFFQHAKNTTVLGPVVFEADNVEVFVGKNDIGDYFRQVELRVYDILVEVKVTTRDKHVDDKEIIGIKNMVHCELKVPLLRPDQFRSTDCTVRGPIWDDDN